MKRRIVTIMTAALLFGSPVVALAQSAAPLSAPEHAAAAAEAPAPDESPPGDAAPQAGADGASRIAVPDDAASDWQANAADFYTAIQSGRWLQAVALGMLLVVFALRRFGTKFSGYFKTRQGGWVLNFGTATAVSIAASMLAVGKLSIGTLLDALMLGFAAAGAYQAARDAKRARDAAAGV